MRHSGSLVAAIADIPIFEPLSKRPGGALNNDIYWLTDKVWSAAGSDVAACIYRFNWKSFIEGKEISGSGRGTSVLRQSDGTWQIVHEHLSKLPD